jgi:hypothetical protein
MAIMCLSLLVIGVHVYLILVNRVTSLAVLRSCVFPYILRLYRQDSKNHVLHIPPLLI